VVDYAAAGLDCARKGEGHRCEVTVSRLGQLSLPVEIEVTFADGSRVRESWDGKQAQRTYVYNGPAYVTCVEVDPDRRLLLDVSPHNNSLTHQPQVGSLVRIFSQWLYAVEHLVLLLGGLW